MLLADANNGVRCRQCVDQGFGNKELPAKFGQYGHLPGAHSQAPKLLCDRQRQPAHFGKGLPLIRVTVDTPGNPLPSLVEVVAVAQIALRRVLQ